VKKSSLPRFLFILFKRELPQEASRHRNREEEEEEKRFFKASSSFKSKNLLISTDLFLITPL